MSEFPFIVTFYSFKGGVGRSMALLNVAYALAARGRNVLVVDMDLEAPGVSGFLARKQEIEHPKDQDMLDLLSWAMQTVTDGVELDVNSERLRLAGPSLTGVASRVLRPRLEELTREPNNLGTVDVVCVDTERDYFSRLQRLGLASLGRRDLVALGKVLRIYFRSREIDRASSGEWAMLEPPASPYDYVLVDSRTGVSETGGLCIGPLADRLVVFSSLNDQNVEGTAAFLHEVGIASRRDSADGAWDVGDVPPSALEAPPRLGPKPTLLVASPVPAGEIDQKAERLAYMERRIGPVAGILSYHPQVSLLESIFVRDYPREYLTQEYLNITDMVMASVDDHPSQLAEYAFRVLQASEGDVRLALRRALRLVPQSAAVALPLLQVLLSFTPKDSEERLMVVRLLHRLRRQHGPRGAAFGESVRMALASHLAELARDTSAEIVDHCFSLAKAEYEAISQRRPANAEALIGWGDVLGDQSDTKLGDEKRSLLDLAARKYLSALELSPSNPRALTNWGNVLGRQAKAAEAMSERAHLFELAGEKYATALAAKPGDHQILTNWGTLLADHAHASSGDEADRLRTLAGEKFEAALAAKRDSYQALTNWGVVLRDQAGQNSRERGDVLYRLAEEKFAAALAIKPDSHQALQNWGGALYEQAKRKGDQEAIRLLRMAGQKYAAAVRVKHGNHGALNNWGNVLREQAVRMPRAEAERLFALAADRFSAALAIRPDSYDALTNWGVTLDAQARRSDDGEAERVFDEAGEKFEAALAIDPQGYAARTNWGSSLVELAKRKRGPEADRLFRLAEERFAEALESKPERTEALTNWAVALRTQALLKSESESDSLWELAGRKCAEALGRDPDDHVALTVWATVLQEQGQRKPDRDADRLWRQANEKYEAALQIRPDHRDALNNQANLFVLRAKRESGAEADRLFSLARDKYLTLSRMYPDGYASLTDWGAAIAEQAGTKTGEAAQRLFEEASEKFAAALKIEPCYVEALKNWGATLLEQSRGRNPEEARQLWVSAEEKLNRAEHVRPGSGAYGLACLCARMGNRSGCRLWLEQAAASGTLPTRSEMTAERDLADISEERWFQQLLRDRF